ncbi:PD-(D/E)XK nuclease-like domain-containing protein [Acidisoma cellulosilytica]|uniref:PD-(D/E)XK nuclease-like domain-containing protein n=1 Tax=Acidisoma cellulosilyticum TaxID=2802395 RepID=A0A964E376_9PROT|nr:PD-(D/E)XK nuclease-like domain-containing protein [Acidisoma cellulosilyticum]MCB8880079.1 PD-(D/E)XK nuclease-like domain-containing protein [Acidisoma cellulosilyticum]
MNKLAPPTISIPGVYEMDAETYHADPCETPSLSAGMINEIIKAPKLCWHNSPRLNPDWEEPDGQEKFSIGTVAHVIFLEPDLFSQKVAVLEYDDYRKNEAKMSRDNALAIGKTPILAKHMDKIEAARDAFMANEFTRQAFSNGRTEMAMFWKHPLWGFWCRARPDFIADSGRHLNDYKATSSADPEKFGKHAFDMGYHRRAAWYLEGATILLGKKPEHYWFANQEPKAPYLTSIVELDEQALDAGQYENTLAGEIFEQCLRTGDWYGYRHNTDRTRDLAFRVGLPTWAHIQIETRNS